MKTHMPSSAVSSRCWVEANCEAKALASCILWLRFEISRILIRSPRHHRLGIKIVLGWRRGRLPFKSGCVPGVGRRAGAEEQRIAEIEHRHQIGDRENHSSA